jgi:RNA polymerase sigma-70 factor (ECF subfamily)
VAAAPHFDAPVLLPEPLTFERLFRDEYRSLVALAWALTGSREAAEDVAQESLLALHRRWDDLHLIDNPRAYVRRTCANLSVSWVRRRVREVHAVLRLQGLRPTPTPVDDATDAFWNAVRRLPRRQAQVVALHYGYDLSVDGVAETLGLAPGTVKVHLHRARTALEPHLTTPSQLGEVT